MYGLIIGVSAGIIGAMGIAGYFYYNDTQATIKELQAVNAAYELRDAEQKAALASLEKDFALQTESLNEMTVRSQEIQAEMNRYLDIFKRHNLTKLAAAKPGLIEKRANKATKGVFDGIENDSRDIDAADDGLQLTPEKGTEGSTDSNKTSSKKDNTADTSKSD
jgi:hypothetical protein